MTNSRAAATTPFIWGAQYYRAPTPDRSLWERDLRHMRDLGFNHVKFWVQWRWSERRPGEFCFDDLDALMDLAARNHLAVTLNTIFDVAPFWLYTQCPDAKMIMADGTIVEPYGVGHRQLGGHPGPCYNHPDALAFRQRFMEAALKHFARHPALSMWDVWNEPELCFPQRGPVRMDKLACYCPSCREKFNNWLKHKYGAIERLNDVWGRCYLDWENIELPYAASTLNDFIDWREFFIDTMTSEARWRLAMTREFSPQHAAYLHVVPNDLAVWNPVTCGSDDFALAQECDVFASTMTGGTLMAPVTLSAANGKVCYNVESHINFGDTSLHPRHLDAEDVRNDLLPQLAMGVKGFLFWQFRPESLGREAPAWGVINADGSERRVTAGIREFTARIMPHRDELLRAQPAAADIGIWKSRRNELFHAAIDRMELLHKSYANYANRLYAANFTFRFIDSDMLKTRRLDGLRLLILPSPYYLDAAEADALNEWINAGGVAICEAHLAGYSPDTGRHAAVIPGSGLAERWGFREVESCAAIHLAQHDDAPDAAPDIANDDVRKALQNKRVSRPLFSMVTPAGNRIAGFDRYAGIAGTFDAEIARFPGYDEPCAVRKKIGKGSVFYFATNPGAVDDALWDGFMSVTEDAATEAGITKFGNPKCLSGRARVERLGDHFIFIRQLGDTPAELELTLPPGEWRGLYTGRLLNGGRTTLRLTPAETDLYHQQQNLRVAETDLCHAQQPT